MVGATSSMGFSVACETVDVRKMATLGCEELFKFQVEMNWRKVWEDRHT